MRSRMRYCLGVVLGEGTTPCFFGDCGPGQFCAADQRCVPGCVSNENCSGEEQCVREPGVARGVCRSCYF